MGRYVTVGEEPAPRRQRVAATCAYAIGVVALMCAAVGARSRRTGAVAGSLDLERAPPSAPNATALRRRGHESAGAHANRIALSNIMARAVNKFSESGLIAWQCDDVHFAFCAASSCTRHSPSSSSDSPVEIAACACNIIRSGESYLKFDITQVQNGFLLQSPEFVDILKSYVEGATDATETKARVCSALREKGSFFPELSPDLLSFPAPAWIDNHPRLSDDGIVAERTCDEDVALALCAGAPCFNDPSAPGVLNATCLCPVYPMAEYDTSTYGLLAPDVGHFGCDAYAYTGGSCAFQGSIDLEGDPEWKWDVAAVANMQEIAVRSTDRAQCRSWFAISS